MLEIFGTRLTLTFALIALAYLLWSTAPIWWPALLAVRRGNIAQPWSFTFTALALIYGATAVVLVLLLAFFKLHDLLVHPAHLKGWWIVSPLGALLARDPGVIALFVVVSHLLLTGWITHTLAVHWELLRARGVASLKVPR